MKIKGLHTIKSLILNVYSPILILAMWEGLSSAGVLNRTFFPPPSAIISVMFRMFREGILLRDIGISIYRIVCGLVLGGIPALFLGIWMGRSRACYYFLHPIVSLTYPVPKIAIIPFVILFFGIGELSKIVVVGLGAFFLVFLNTYHGVANIDRRYFDAARIYAYSGKDLWTRIIIPAAMPSIFNGLKLASGMCFILVVAAEFIGGSSGIGYRIWTSWEAFDITGMFAALVTLALLGWAFTFAIELIERAVMPWRKA